MRVSMMVLCDDVAPFLSSLQAISGACRRCRVDFKQPQNLMSLAALVLASAAFGISMLNSFPGLKLLFAVVRDAVLWMALFFVLGVVAYMGYQRIEKLPKSPASESKTTIAQGLEAPR